MNKRFLSLLMAFALLVSILPIALAEQADALPAVGEALEGFEVIGLDTQLLISAQAVLLKHIKTGAEVYYIRTADINRAFDITFRTPAIDNTGLPHVFEHITISGSSKYPSPNLFFPLVTQTYNTYVNAFTRDTNTSYPLASLSEDQLLAMADVYLDGVFNPLIYQEERLYRREAWRYTLEEKDAPLSITGTVYNEMKGARTQGRMATLELHKSLYPGTRLGNEFGGDPDFIPDMTYQDLLDFHGAYYHPSNALVILYGDLNLERFLALLDGYFTAYERQDISLDIGTVPALSETADVTLPFPVERGSAVDGAVQVDYGFALTGISPEDQVALDIVSSALTHPSSKLVEALRKALPGANVNAGVNASIAVPTFEITVTGINEMDKSTVKELIDAELARVFEEGLDRELLDVIAANLKLQTLMIPDSPFAGLNVAVTLADDWARTGKLDSLNQIMRLLDEMPRLSEEKHFEALISRYLLENPHRAIVTTVPTPGLAERNADAFAQKMAELKASMKDEELDAIIAAGADLQAFSEQEAPAEIVDAVKVLNVQNLPEETETYPVTDETREDGVRVLLGQANVPSIGVATLHLDTSSVPVSDLPYLLIYTNLVGNLSTSTYSRDELSKLLTRYASDFSATPSMQEAPKNVYSPMLTVSWKGFTGEASTALGLVYDALFETQFTEMDVIESIVQRMKNMLRESAIQSPLNVQLLRVVAVFEENDAYNEALNGISAYQALSAIEAQLGENPEQVVEKLLAIQALLKNKKDARVLFVGDAESADEFTDALDGFLDMLPTANAEMGDLSVLPRPSRREALSLDSQVQYNVLYAPLSAIDLAYSGILTPFGLYVYDAYLTPKIRHGIGAYDSIFMVDENDILLASYRDPSVAETYKVFEELPDFVESAEVTQDALDGYIMKAYSSLAMPLGQLNGAMSALRQRLLGREESEVKLQRMREMKTFSPDDFARIAESLRKLVEVGARSTAGSATVIEQNSGLFDGVLSLD